MDLIQVHNLVDVPTQMGVLKELKEDGRIRYIGTTSTRASRYGDLEKAMRDYPIDFIGVDYAVDNRLAAERILPAAKELGIATLIYVPFGRSRLFSRTKGMDVPEWAQEFGADSWGKFFIKYVAAHPATTCVTPATSKAKNMLDNIGAAYGELPDAAALRKMEELVDGLPSASRLETKYDPGKSLDLRKQVALDANRTAADIRTALAQQAGTGLRERAVSTCFQAQPNPRMRTD